MNGRGNGPLSPISMGESEWSGISNYQKVENELPYRTSSRGQLASPPISSDSNSTMNGGGFPRGPGDNSNGPSPPSSVARSSNGASLYNGSTLYSASDKGRNRKDEQFEQMLAEHYVALKRYLAASLRDEKGNPRPTKARDKLLRLSPVQFQELSTDVFDELLRRQAAGRRPSNAGLEASGPPPYLLPKDSFHPKRNQARQKLSTLPPPRFRDLATDVFFELERRFPRFSGGDIGRTDSPASMRGPPSRSANGTPVEGGNGYRPGSRGGTRMRRPSETSSISAYARSDSRNDSRNGGPMNGGPMNGGPMNGGPMNGGPGGPGSLNNDYGRPLAKTFQSNTIVPVTSTMVEDDDDPTGGEDNDDEDAFGLENAARARESKRSLKTSAIVSETDKKIIDDYQSQVAELREKLELTEEKFRLKDEELNTLLDGERSRTTIANVEKQEWADLRLKLENKLADAQNLNESLQSELDRLRAEQSNTELELRSQLEEIRTTNVSHGGNPDLERENRELRADLEEQQQVTEDVRREAQSFLREMKILSEQSGSSWDREEQLSSQVSRLEEEVKDWRNRYARTKTQLRSLRASSFGLTIQMDAAKYTTDSAFTQSDGLVKDVHVTKFQISIDELLQVARTEDPVRVVDYMKFVVVNVRNITQDIDESSVSGGELAHQQAKLKSRVSATANNLITASKNFAAAKGLSPLSLLDAAASHLTAAVVELVRTVKIRPTPAGELEDDDDGTLPAAEASGFVSTLGGEPEITAPPFQGLRMGHESAVSSMYSPVNSPRQSTAARPRSSSAKDSWASRRPISHGTPLANGLNGLNANEANSPHPNAPGLVFGIRVQDTDVEDLRIYLEDQTALLVQTIQSLVSSIRSEAGITAITTEITAIATVVGKVVSATETAMSSSNNNELRLQGDTVVQRLSACRQKLVDAGIKGRAIADLGDEDEARAEMDWRVWTQALPPIAFEIARETKELVQRVDGLEGANPDESF